MERKALTESTPPPDRKVGVAAAHVQAGHLLFDRLLRREAILIDEPRLQLLHHRFHVRCYSPALHKKTEYTLTRASEHDEEPPLVFTERRKNREFHATLLA